jgi:hypothetical protein
MDRDMITAANDTELWQCGFEKERLECGSASYPLSIGVPRSAVTHVRPFCGVMKSGSSRCRAPYGAR